MLTKKLTCYTYLRVCGGHKVAARLDAADPQKVNAIITESSETVKGMFGEDVKLHDDQHYLVGEIADRLYAYESLGYSPEELKKIVEEHKRLKATTNAVAECKTMVSFKNGEHLYVATARQNGKTNLQLQMYKQLINSLYGCHDDVHLQIENVIFNDPATIVFWKDGTKTVVKATNEDFDPEKGLAMAIAKKALGNKGNYFDKIKKWVKKYEKEYEEEHKAKAEAKRIFSEFEASMKRLQNKTAAFQWSKEDTDNA